MSTTPASPAGADLALHFQDSEALRLINVETEAAACQTTFFIPPREERERGRGPRGERLWVQVTEAQKSRYEGLIDNDPVVFPDLLRCGMAVAFGPEHIAKIEQGAAPAAEEEVELPACHDDQEHDWQPVKVAGRLSTRQRACRRCELHVAEPGGPDRESPPAADPAQPQPTALQSAPRQYTPEEWLEEAHGLYPAGHPCPCATCRFARQAVQLRRQLVDLQRATEAPEGIGEAAINRPPGYIVRGVDVPPGWMLVRLETAAGDYVIAARVPAFLTLPAVLVWGDRTFALSRRAGGGGYHAHYRECFTVVVLQVADVEEEEAPPPAPTEWPSTETASKGVAMRALWRFATAWAGGAYIPPSADVPPPPPAPLDPGTLRYCGLILRDFLGNLTDEVVALTLLLGQEPAPSLAEEAQSVFPEPPLGEHWWGTGGTCARCHARASLAMNTSCAWRPPAAPIEVR